jgi:hypothetical protein
VQRATFPEGYALHELPADYTGKLWIEGQVRYLHQLTAAQPAPVLEPAAWVDALFDAIKHGDQDHQNWLQEKLKSWVISNPPPLQPAPVEKPAARKENYSDDTRYGTGGSYAQGGCYGPAAFTDGDHDGY